MSAIFTPTILSRLQSSRLAPCGVYTFVLMTHAWRNVKSRGWRAGLTIALLALALAANTVVFSAADSFVLHRVPYADPDRLVEIPSRNPQTGVLGSPFISPGLLDEWRRHADLFADVEGYLTKTLFLTG